MTCQDNFEDNDFTDEFGNFWIMPEWSHTRYFCCFGDRDYRNGYSVLGTDIYVLTQDKKTDLLRWPNSHIGLGATVSDLNTIIIFVREAQAWAQDNGLDEARTLEMILLHEIGHIFCQGVHSGGDPNHNSNPGCLMYEAATPGLVRDMPDFCHECKTQIWVNRSDGHTRGEPGEEICPAPQHTYCYFDAHPG